MECDLYLQPELLGPIAMTPPGLSAEVAFGTYDPASGVLPATIGRTELVRSDNSTVTIESGKFTLVVKEAN